MSYRGLFCSPSPFCLFHEHCALLHRPSHHLLALLEETLRGPNRFCSISADGQYFFFEILDDHEKFRRRTQLGATNDLRQLLNYLLAYYVASVSRRICFAVGGVLLTAHLASQPFLPHVSRVEWPLRLLHLHPVAAPSSSPVFVLFAPLCKAFHEDAHGPYSRKWIPFSQDTPWAELLTNFIATNIVTPDTLVVALALHSDLLPTYQQAITLGESATHFVITEVCPCCLFNSEWRRLLEQALFQAKRRRNPPTSFAALDFLVKFLLLYPLAAATLRWHFDAQDLHSACNNCTVAKLAESVENVVSTKSRWASTLPPGVCHLGGPYVPTRGPVTVHASVSDSRVITVHVPHTMLTVQLRTVLINTFRAALLSEAAHVDITVQQWLYKGIPLS